MNLKRELQKLRLFLFTPAPYIAGVIGILLACVAFAISPNPYFEHLRGKSSAKGSLDTGEKFSFCYAYLHDPSKIETIKGAGYGFLTLSTFPSRALTTKLMEIDATVNPSISLERFNRTYGFLFGYLNFYFWLFSAFAVYSFHWEVTDETSEFKTKGLLLR